MIFSKATGYGIRALAYLAKHAGENPCGLREIAEAEQIPPLYLSKVLGDLRRQRLVRSTKGIHGGCVLAQQPQEISLALDFGIGTSRTCRRLVSSPTTL